jgi:hypothetical protein
MFEEKLLNQFDHYACPSRSSRLTCPKNCRLPYKNSGLVINMDTNRILMTPFFPNQRSLSCKKSSSEGPGEQNNRGSSRLSRPKKNFNPGLSARIKLQSNTWTPCVHRAVVRLFKEKKWDRIVNYEHSIEEAPPERSLWFVFFCRKKTP